MRKARLPSIAVKNLESLLHLKQFGGTLGRIQEVPRVAPTGVPALDQATGGGWRRGAMSELVGRRSSGRTGVVLRTMAEATRQGQVVALVDALDRFDPRGAVDLGVRLELVLWVRGAPLTVEMARPGLVEQAVKQAVRAGDLIVRAGGFGIVVIDLADVPARRIRAVPAITWLRLAHSTEGRDTVCLLIGDTTMGRSALGVSVDVAARACWTGGSAQSRRLDTLTPAFTVRAARMMPVSAPPEASLSQMQARA